MKLTKRELVTLIDVVEKYRNEIAKNGIGQSVLDQYLELQIKLEDQLKMEKEDTSPGVSEIAKIITESKEPMKEHLNKKLNK